MKRFSAVYGVILIATILLSCKKDSIFGGNSEESTAYEVDSCFVKYVEVLEKEANLRGRNLNFKETGLIIKTVPKNHFGTGGFTGFGYYNSKPPKIEITEDLCIDDTVYHYWIEELIFHEYGHAGLNRDHVCDTFPDGMSKSLMHGVHGNASTTACPNKVNIKYEANRSYYLDELFGVN